MKQNWEFKNKSLHVWLFISDKGAKATQWGKRLSLIPNGVWTVGYLHTKNELRSLNST